MIELKNLSVGYGGRPVLEDISLTFPSGQITVLLGPNGCGKSTLLKSLVGLAQISGGTVNVSGKALADWNRAELARQVSYLPQTRRVPDMTVERLVLHGRFPYLSYPRRYRREDREMARQAMEQVGIADLACEDLKTLSGGTRQKAYIAMALAQDTGAILLDEPTTHLDIAHQLQLMALCRALADRGKAVVVVLHDLDLALGWADRIALLSGGRLLATGTGEELCRSGALEEAFQVEVIPVDTPFGLRYVCRGPGKEKK